MKKYRSSSEEWLEVSLKFGWKVLCHLFEESAFSPSPLKKWSWPTKPRVRYEGTKRSDDGLSSGCHSVVGTESAPLSLASDNRRGGKLEGRIGEVGVVDSARLSSTDPRHGMTILK